MFDSNSEVLKLTSLIQNLRCINKWIKFKVHSEKSLYDKFCKHGFNLEMYIKPIFMKFKWTFC